jgi:site-specific DNA-adenine methylase
MSRVKFNKGEQREYLDLVIQKLNCLSLRGLLQFGFNVNYSTLRNYYIERRLLPLNFFQDLNHLAKINQKNLKITILGDNWGQSLGGKKSKRFKK